MSCGLATRNSSDFQLELSVTQALCEILDTPRSLTVWLLIKYKEFKQLVDLEIDPSDYQDHSTFADDYLATKVLSKSPSLPLGIDRKKAALDSFWESEQRCAESNLRISRRTFPDVVEKAHRLIRKVLGPLRRVDLDFVESNFRFGPGATTCVRGAGFVPSDKYDAEMHLTHGLIPYYRSILGETWWSQQRRPVVVEGNKFTTVPKNAKTERGICIEPTLNIYGQLGVGKLLRHRLKRLGVDLHDQGRNQFLASKAQDWELATIDLSAASDSTSWKCVMELLPPDWFELLDLFRSSHSLVEGSYVELEKFSSMGNGYTFELETLIFSAVAFSTVPLHDHHKVSVYGDDIIVPSYAAPMVINALEYLGFRVNSKKSFLAGNFFESCGTDWFNGQNVRPFYLDRGGDNKIPYRVQIANQLRLYASRRMNGLGCDARFRPLWKSLFRDSPASWKRCLVPAQLGDLGFIVSHDEHRCPRVSSVFPEKRFWEGWVCSTVSVKPYKVRKTSLGRLLSALACPQPDMASHGFEVRRGLYGKVVPRRTIVSQWSMGLTWT